MFEGLTPLNSNTAVNLSAIATIRFTGPSTELTAEVHFLGGSTSAGVSAQHFEGDAAKRLYEIINGQVESPLSENELDETEPNAALSLSPAFAKTKGWYYLVQTDGRGYILAFINAKGSCSMRTFSAANGQFIKRQYSQGNYQEKFAGFIKDAIELTVPTQPNLEKYCRERLPADLLAYLKKQVS